MPAAARDASDIASVRSNTATLQPAAASSRAVASPMMPPPAIATSADFMLLILGAAFHAGTRIARKEHTKVTSAGTIASMPWFRRGHPKQKECRVAAALGTTGGQLFFLGSPVRETSARSAGKPSLAHRATVTEPRRACQ